MNVEKLREEFENWTKEFHRIGMFVTSLLEQYSQTSGKGIVRSYTLRIKEWRSFLKKVEEKGFSENEIFEKIDDILGVRIVCIFRSELDLIDEWVKNTFDVIDEKRYEWSPIPKDQFKEEMGKVAKEGYTSIHYIVKLNKADITSKGFKACKFEIQARTMLQDAWAEFNHEIYKSKEEIPLEIFRDKVILSKYLSAMNDHFESVRDMYLKVKPLKEALESRNFEGKDFSGQELMRVDFSHCNLRGTKFIESKLLWCNLDGADLSGADLTKADLVFAKIRNAKLTRTILCGTDMSYADLSGSNLNYANLEKASLSYADLSHAKLECAKLRYAELSFAVLKQTSFKKSDLRNVHLVYNYYFEEANFEGADRKDALIVKR